MTRLTPGRRMTRRIAISGGAAGYLAEPQDASNGAAVVLTGAIAGINDYLIEVAEQLAADGYPTLVLDYYARNEGRPPDLSSPEKIMSAVRSLDDAQILADMSAATAWLRSNEVGARRVASVGFCIGGTYSLLAAAAEIEGLSCAVAFYGMLRYPATWATKPESPLDAAPRSTIPVLAHYGDADHLVPAEDAHELAARLNSKPAEVYVYPGAGHAFHENSRPDVYRPVAAQDAWARTVIYLDWYLRDARPGVETHHR